MNTDYLSASFADWSDRNITSLAIIGAGWHGLPLAVKLAGSGVTVKASTTSPSKIPVIALGGVIPYLADVNVSESEDWGALMRVDALVVTVPPSVLSPGLKNLLRRIESSPVRRIVYISSTAVYPDEPGVYSEGMAVHRVSKHSGINLLALEDAFRSLNDRAVSVLRFGGLFGPNRHPSGFFSTGRTIPDPDGNVNMLTLEDAVNAVICVLVRSAGGDVYNVCSPGTTSRKDFYSLAFSQAGLELPPFGESRGNSRIIDSSAIVDKLGFEFRYASVLEALRKM